MGKTARMLICASLFIVLPDGDCVPPVEEPVPDWVSRLAVQAYNQSTGRELALQDLKLRPRVEYSIDPKFVQYLLSPTGDLVAFRTPGGQPQKEDLWLAHQGDFQAKRLTSSRWGLWWPKWSPSGDRIAFVQKHFDELAVYTPLNPATDVRGFSLVIADVETGATQEVTPRWYYSEQYPESIDWAPDGTAIAFNASTEPISEIRSSREIYIVDLSADPPVVKQLTKNHVTDQKPVFSPDGNHIVFQRYDPGPFEKLFLLDLREGTEKYIAGGIMVRGRGSFSVLSAEWYPDSTGLSFRGWWNLEHNRRPSVYSYDLISGATQLVKRGELKY